ncbi:Uncharacterised protein [Starkeya nomas]|uniref:Uncharacterized protein n=1 Tax=Starkeya nomas TaxID=2666134 RepID=A0A5S9PFV0_9HYPH|nr:Uncharacterised protein [Starkeya nomas]
MGASITPENLTVRYATPPNSEPNLTTINRLVLIRARRYRVAVRMLTEGQQVTLDIARPQCRPRNEHDPDHRYRARHQQASRGRFPTDREGQYGCHEGKCRVDDQNVCDRRHREGGDVAEHCGGGEAGGQAEAPVETHRFRRPCDGDGNKAKAGEERTPQDQIPKPKINCAYEQASKAPEHGSCANQYQTVDAPFSTLFLWPLHLRNRTRSGQTRRQ